MAVRKVPASHLADVPATLCSDGTDEETQEANIPISVYRPGVEVVAQSEHWRHDCELEEKNYTMQEKYQNSSRYTWTTWRTALGNQIK